MKFTSTAILASLAAMTSAQATYEESTGAFKCPVANGAYCGGNSMETQLIILCTAGVGLMTNCSSHAASRPPIDIYSSPCYQSDVTSGTAACSKQGIAYPDNGDPYPLPAGANDTSSSGSGTGSGDTTEPTTSCSYPASLTATMTQTWPAPQPTQPSNATWTSAPAPPPATTTSYPTNTTLSPSITPYSSGANVMAVSGLFALASFVVAVIAS